LYCEYGVESAQKTKEIKRKTMRTKYPVEFPKETRTEEKEIHEELSGVKASSPKKEKHLLHELLEIG
jgi:hypothetical protein